MVESNLPELDLEDKTYSEAFDTLRNRGLEVFYESRTSVLTPFQRELYEKTMMRMPRKVAVLLDPIVVAFAIHDACDLSDSDYVWLDLEGDDDVGNSAWIRGRHEEITDLAMRLLKTHLEKYIVDAYDRHTREDMVRVWEAQLKLLACPICGEPSLERKPILTNRQIIRSWACTSCGHHIAVQVDVLKYLQTNSLLNE